MRFFSKVVWELRHPWRDGTTHFVFDPLTFLARLAALVPHPREHLLTYHGVLAPASSWRDEIVPAPTASQPAIETIPHPVPSQATPGLLPPAPPSPPPPPPPPPWAELMKRVFEIDVLHCTRCGGRRRLIALITDSLVARRILRQLDLPSEPPPPAPARPPPQRVLGF